MAEVIEDEEIEGKIDVHLSKGESALIFANEGIYQVLSDEFKDIIKEANETQGKSLVGALETCEEKDATKVLNDFVLLQLVNLLAEIIQSLGMHREDLANQLTKKTE